MADLVALDLPGGPEFARALAGAWEAGDAVAPIDRRLAPPARRRLLDMLRPAWVVDERGRHPCEAAVDIAAGDALVMATSGTSGEPKGVVLTHDAVSASARATSDRLGADPARHRWLACLPLSHVGGLSVVTRALLTGTALEVHDGFDAARVLAAAGPEVLVSLVPTALRRVGPDNFAKVVLGGSAPPERLPANVVVTYGLTETGSGVVYDGLPLDGVDISLGPSGEIWLRGPMLLRCYRDGAVPLDPNGWFATGDIGHLDFEGRLQVDGRASDMIVTGGENVWPAAVEAVISGHRGVAEVAVSSRPDAEWGERVVACVVSNSPGEAPTLGELRALVHHHLAPFAVPKELVLVPRIPRTAIGKVRRDELRRMLAGDREERPARWKPPERWAPDPSSAG